MINILEEFKYILQKARTGFKTHGISTFTSGSMAYLSTKFFLALQRIPRQRIIYSKAAFKKNINIGAGIDWCHEDFIAVDKYYEGKQGIQLDLLEGKGLLSKFEENSVDAIYSTHTIEHFTYEEALKIVTQCYSILRKNGAIRIVVPDMLLICTQFAVGPRSWWKYNNMSGHHDYSSKLVRHKKFMHAIGLNEHGVEMRGEIEVSRGSHFYAYSYEILKELLIKAGFPKENIYQCRFRQTRHKVFSNLDDRLICSLHVEAIK